MYGCYILVLGENFKNIVGMLSDFVFNCLVVCKVLKPVTYCRILR